MRKKMLVKSKTVLLVYVNLGGSFERQPKYAITSVILVYTAYERCQSFLAWSPIEAFLKLITPFWQRDPIDLI